MKLFLASLLLILITGCATPPAPIVMKFPDVPEDMLKNCPDLKTVDPSTTKLSEILEVVVENYGQYYDCKANSEDWIEWYKQQKKIFEKVNK